MNISFTEKQEQFIRDRVASGDFKNASEVVRAAIRMYDEEYQRKVDYLRRELQKGVDSPASDMTIPEIFTEAKARYHAEKKAG